MLSKKKDAQLRIHNLQMEFDGNPVLQDLDLTIGQGEFIAIVGRSGCGKSTLLRIIAGLEQPVAGVVNWQDDTIKGINDDIRVLFQDARLLPWKKVLDNVRIGTFKKDRVLAVEALHQVGLGDRGDEWPHVLSGGQKQRVALARALSGKPKLMLLDEPLGALDALTRIEMQQLIEKLWLEQGFTVILVTHDVSEAVALADRVLLIEQGRIAMDTRISLARPRERDSGFIHYEKLILDRIMVKEKPQYDLQSQLVYTI
ncbi:MAG: ATP-binding cassette domain-containing protein [Gorillibacterium sp.]|nr:ATP-binding cassette domain-containing protein [Gorillibacterium sp.]